MKNLIIIPSRLESSRLPNKPLADINEDGIVNILDVIALLNTILDQ